MIYRQYGKTGKSVSLLGFGGMRFPEDELKTSEGIEKYAQLLVYGAEKGINYFDTAPDYCGAKSELVFGLAVEEMKRRKLPFYFSTKTRVHIDPTADAVLRRIETSLKFLNVDKISFFHMWCILNLEEYHKIMEKGGAYEGALKAKEAGLIEHICFSTHANGNEIKQIIEDNVFEGVTLGYNILNFKFREEGVQAAQKACIGVVTMNPLSGGLIPQFADKFAFLKTSPDEEITDVALKFNASHPAISVVLSGIQSERDIEANVHAIDSLVAFDIATVEKVKTQIPEAFNTLCTGCGYCRHCPQDIPIDKLMNSYNYYMLSDSVEKSKAMLANDWSITSYHYFNCIQCGECEACCTQHLPIMERIAAINSWNVEFIEKAKQRLAHTQLGNKAVSIGIYPCGSYALNQLKLYEMFFGAICANLYFFDSNPAKWGSAVGYNDACVLSPDAIDTYNLQEMLIANEKHFASITHSLNHLAEKNVLFKLI